MNHYNYDTTVTLLAHTAVFKQSHHPRFQAGSVALKITSLPRLCDNGDVHEARIYKMVCPHPSIPDFVECGEDDFDTSFFMAKECHRGVQRLPVLVIRFVRALPVHRLFMSFPVLHLPVVKRVAEQTAAVLQHLHCKSIVYGDLKLPNVLLSPCGHVWVVDFASAVFVDNGQPVRRNELSNGITLHMRAPELFVANSGENDKSTDDEVLVCPFLVDFWAFGAFLLELLTGRPALISFDLCSGALTEVEFEGCVRSGLDLVAQRYDDSCAVSLRALLTGLLERNPERRIRDWTVVREHPFLVNALATPMPCEYDEEIDELMLGL